MPKQNQFTCYVNFWRYDKNGKRVGFPRKNGKLRLEVVAMDVKKDRSGKKKAILHFADGTHVGPFRYSKWYPSSRVAVIASNYSKFCFSNGKHIKEDDDE